MRFSKWRPGRNDNVNLSERDGVRSLHLGSERVQSAMRLACPDDLELAYTRAMMGFLLFEERPQRITMIGLGGGSLAKFVYRRLPWVGTTVVEVNPRVLAAARGFFFLPAEDERFHVELAEGGEYASAHPESADVLMVDGFDDGSHADTLCTLEFYHAAREALTGNGILVLNFFGNDRRLDAYLKRVEASFDGRVLCLEAERDGNVIAFALKRNLNKIPWGELRERAKKLEQAYGLPFPKFVRGLRKMNPHTDRNLLFKPPGNS